MDAVVDGDDSDVLTPILPFKRKRLCIASLSSSDEEQDRKAAKAEDDTVVIGSDSENTQDELGLLTASDVIPNGKMNPRQQVQQEEKEKRALAILKERSFNCQLDEEQLLAVLRTHNFDVIRAERQIRQQQAVLLKNGLVPMKTTPKKQYYTVRRNIYDDSDDDNVRPLVVKRTSGTSEYLNLVAKSSATGTALLSDDELDEVQAVEPPRKQLPTSGIFSRPSAISLPSGSDPVTYARKPKAFKPKAPRGKRRFDVYHSDDDEDGDVDSFIADSDEEDDVILSDDEADKKKRRSKKKTNKTTKGPKSRGFHAEDELTQLTDSEDEFEEREDIVSSSDEDGDKVSPRTMKRIERSDKQSSLRDRVVKFMNEATSYDLQSISGVSGKKAEQIVSLRPFANYLDLRLKLESAKGLNTDLINDSLEAIKSRDVIHNLMSECESLSSGITKKVQNLMEAKQPMILNKDCVLKQYQLIGLNWLVLMHEKNINAILADEMGLGKTIQVIALLAYLKEKQQNRGPHLIVVPASTLDNWDRELALWCRHLDVLVYHGSQKERQETRFKIFNAEVSFEILLTTYNMLFSEDDKKLFKKYKFQYIVFDEAHLLKNMKTNRYAQLMTIKSHRRLLLTGTPLQNNLLELMSLLIFTMPDFFVGKTEQVKAMFTFNNFTCKGDASQSQDSVTYEQERIAHAKKIMKPFILRRLKADVLQQLPPKTLILKKISMTSRQEQMYKDLVACYQKDIEHDISIMEEVDVNDEDSNEEVRELKMADGHVKSANRNGIALKARAGASMIMNLRKVANHPLLIREYYTDAKLRQMAKLMLNEKTHKDANADFIREDMEVYSDFELHELCLKFKSINKFKLPNKMILESGKLRVLDEILPGLKAKKQKVLLFSQFCMVLDIIEVYMQMRDHKYIRLDGGTKVDDRLDLIDEFNKPESDIFVFLLTTRAGGVGINLTAATTAIIHDLDFNPYNDKQAEDRCHRLGQKSEVTIYKFVTEDSIEEGILNIAENKLRLGNDLCVARKPGKEEIKNDMKSLLRGVLGL